MNAKEVELEQDAYIDWLDDVYGEVSVCGYNMYASTILEKCDPIAFRCGFSDWEDFMRQDNNMDWECGECGKVFEGNTAEEDAESCCKDEDVDEEVL